MHGKIAPAAQLVGVREKLTAIALSKSLSTRAQTSSRQLINYSKVVCWDSSWPPKWILRAHVHNLCKPHKYVHQTTLHKIGKVVRMTRTSSWHVGKISSYDHQVGSKRTMFHIVGRMPRHFPPKAQISPLKLCELSPILCHPNSVWSPSFKKSWFVWNARGPLLFTYCLSWVFKLMYSVLSCTAIVGG